MGRRVVNGYCRICGSFGKLSFEHVPPKAAFNDRPISVLKGLGIFEAGHDPRRGRVQQKGAGEYTLCERCNNQTGHWYGQAYVEWACQGLQRLELAPVEPSQWVRYGYKIHPLRVIKQIICMFFSANAPRFRESHTYLEKFVLNHDLKGLPPRLQIFCFLLAGRMGRQAGVSGTIDVRTGTMRILSEIAFPPYGYVLCVGSPPPDERLLDITFFAESRFDEVRKFYLPIPVLPVNTAYPGDYRSAQEVASQARRNGI